MNTTITFSVTKYNLNDDGSNFIKYSEYTMQGNAGLDLHIKHFFVIFLDEILNVGPSRYVSAIGCDTNKSLDILMEDRGLYSVEAKQNISGDTVDIDLSKDLYVNMVNNLLLCYKYSFEYAVVGSGKELTEFKRVHILALGRTITELIRSDLNSELKTRMQDPFDSDLIDNNGVKFIHTSAKTADGVMNHLTCLVYRIP